MKHVKELLAPIGFVPTETFEAIINGHKNRYLAGRTYTIRPEAVCQDLYDQAQEWFAAGKITWGAASGYSVKKSTMTLEAK